MILEILINIRSEFLDDPENKIVRPRQNYVGYGKRDYIPEEKREEKSFYLESTQTSRQKRREAALIKN